MEKMGELYSIKQKKNSTEYHIFISVSIDSEKVKVQNSSICGLLKKSYDNVVILTGVSEDSARKKCAELGKNVCAVCVKYLYTTYK